MNIGQLKDQIKILKGATKNTLNYDSESSIGSSIVTPSKMLKENYVHQYLDLLYLVNLFFFPFIIIVRREKEIEVENQYKSQVKAAIKSRRPITRLKLLQI
jgi:hypothetical protein